MHKAHIRRTIFFGILGLLAALAAALLSPKVYEGRVEMLLGDSAQARNSTQAIYTPDVASIVARGESGSAQTERQLLSSQSVFFQALQRVAERSGNNDLVVNWVDYYRMYDIEMARTVNQQDQNAGVAMLMVRTYSPQISADIANEIAFVYNDVRRRQAREAVNDAIRYLEGQIPLAQQDLKGAEDRYRQFKETQKVSDIASATRDEETYRGNLRQVLQGAESALASVEAEIAVQKRQLTEIPKTQVESQVEAVSQEVSGYQVRLAELRAQRELLLGTYLPDSTNVRNIDEAIAAIQKQLNSAQKKGLTGYQTATRPTVTRTAVEQALVANESRRASLQSQVATTRAALSSQETVLRSLPQKEVSLLQMQRDLAIYDEKYRRLKTMAEDLRNRSETGSRSATVLNSAVPDENHISPQLGKFLLIGATAGLCLGLVISFIIESLRLRAGNSATLTQLTGLPVVASVPALRGASSRPVRSLACADTSPGESFRFLAFSLVNEGDVPKTFAFTGIRQGAQSTSGAVQFALALARTGTRTILVDGDLTTKAVTRGFDASAIEGISDVLSGEFEPQENLLGSTAHEGLRLLTAGKNTRITSLADAPHQRFDALAAWLKTQADVVVWAVPPCDVLADASVVAEAVDEVCLVVSAKNTNLRQVPTAHDLLIRAGAKKVSLVLSDASPEDEPFSSRSTYLAKAE